MMPLFKSQTDEAVITHQSKLKKMDLKMIPGKNVDTAVSLSVAALVYSVNFWKGSC
jgi:hypothetical protein